MTSIRPCTRSRRIAAAAALLAIVAAGLAAVPARADLDDQFYPPELLQRHGRQAGVTDEQLQMIHADVQATRLKMVDAEARVKKLHIEIETLIADDATPLEAIVAKVEAIGLAETELKKLHVGLLVRIRRALAPEQRRRLDELRPQHPAPKPAHPPQPVPPAPPHPHGR